MKERRRHPRLSCYLNVIGDRRIEGTISKDISLHGMFIMTDPALFKKGDEFYITINLPTRPVPVEIKSTVVRIADEGIGVEFANPSSFDLENIKECLVVLRGTFPAKRLQVNQG